MRSESSDGEPAPTIWVVVARYLFLYLLWFLICGIALWLVFLIRQNIVDDIFFLRVTSGLLRAIDRWSLFALGAVWIVSIFLIEGVLRKALEQGRLLIRAGFILATELALVALSFFIRII